MQLKLVREVFSDQSSIGRLYANGIFLAYTLEPVDRGLTDDMTIEQVQEIKGSNPPGTTAIAYGTYPITIYNSPDHHMLVPLVNNTKDFGYVELHIGNYPKDTKACVLLGESRGIDFINNSKMAFDKVFPIIEEALKTSPVTLQITK